MKATSLGGICKILLLCLLFFSCSSDLNFDQAKDLKLEPVYVANLAYFDLPANQIIADGTPQEVEVDEQEFDAFRDKFFRDNLVKAVLDFELDNTIARAFTIEIVLKNSSNQDLDVITINSPAYSGTTNITKQSEIFEGQKLALLKQTTKIAFRVQLASGPPLGQNSKGNLKLRSSATVYMLIE